MYPSRSTVFRKQSLSAMATELKELSRADRGELPYHELIPSKTYKQVFALLDFDNMKNARLVCKKFHLELFPLLKEKSSFTFKGFNNLSDLIEARKLADFLKVVPRDGFQWKMLSVMYPHPENAVPVPMLIQWSHLKIHNASFLELNEWVFRAHTVNVSFLDLYNVPINWKKYLLIFREFENLTRFHDTCTNLSNGIYEEFEQGCAYNEKLQGSQEFQQIRSEDLTFLSVKLQHVQIKRARLEELILHLKMIVGMDCKSLETLKLSAEDCFGSFFKCKKKNVRLSEIKTAMFAHLALILKKNSRTLTQLSLSFQQSSISQCFDQYSKYYDDAEAYLYKPDLRDFIAYMNYHRWDEFDLGALTDLNLEFENRKIASVQEIDGFANFLISLKSLKTLKISHFLVTPDNSPSVPRILKRLKESESSNSTCHCSFGISLKSGSDGLQHKLPANLDLFYSTLSSIITTCQSHYTDLKPSLFSSLDKPETTVENFWVIDNRHQGRTTALFNMRHITQMYPNLTSLIIKDSVHTLRCCASDVIRWNIVDDYGMQLILKHLVHLKHIDLTGNLVYLTDSGITGISWKACDRMSTLNDFTLKNKDVKGHSFGNLKNLEHCSLHYLGTKVTDVTLHFGFNGLSKLNTLFLSGLIQISKEALELTRKNFPASKGCEVVIQSVPI